MVDETITTDRLKQVQWNKAVKEGRIDAATVTAERDLSLQWERAKDHFAPLADFSALAERLDALDRRSIEILAEVKELRRWGVAAL